MQRNRAILVSACLAGAALAVFAPAQPAGTSAPRRRLSPEEKLAAQIDAAKAEALERFRSLRSPGAWQKLLARDLGRLRLEGVPTAAAAKAVADKLGCDLVVAPGVAGTVTYDKAGTLEDFTREGLNPRYWYLSLEKDTLHLKPFVATMRGTLSSERGQHFNAHPEDMEAVTARNGGIREYDERFFTDPAGAVTVHGRVWFIDNVKRDLKITD